MQFTLAVAGLASLAMAAPPPSPCLRTRYRSSAEPSLLPRSGSHFCGGSLLNANTVITAAHCSVGQSASSVSVRAGSLKRNSGGVLVGVSRIIVNPSYSSSTYNNDVAIWKLSTSIPTSSTISYATLPAANADPVGGANVQVAGWHGSSTIPVDLRKVTVPIVSRTTCRSQYGTSAITNNMVCAGVSTGGRDSCQGDSGGPLVDASKTLIGIVSWGDGCAQANAAGVYARVSTLLSFVQANL
ncbi:trypsin A chain [Colletotrichum tofieldiae]|nr:trypsin A chain [Colletotrichum tofieldiae]